jgi:large subunit ribosomal protein L18e
MVKKSKKKSGTKKIISELQRFGKKKKQMIWLKVAETLEKPSRSRPKVNLWKLALLAEKNKEKILVVPGKVLGDGELEKKIEVAALSVSVNAMKKISEVKGRFYSFNELMEKNVSPSKMVIVK